MIVPKLRDHTPPLSNSFGTSPCDFKKISVAKSLLSFESCYSKELPCDARRRRALCYSELNSREVEDSVLTTLIEQAPAFLLGITLLTVHIWEYGTEFPSSDTQI